MSILHTKFLVHWTDRDFELKPNNLNDEKREKYVERLKDIIENGFYMNFGKEKINDNRNERFTAGISRVCFTEIKLSSVHKHAKQYGLLGVGVDRSFVLERYGNPVFYQYNGKFNCIAENLRNVRDYLNKNDKDMLKKLEVVLAYCKNMNKQDEEDFYYYDELEWRIVHLNRLLNEGKIKLAERDENGKEVFRVILKPEDIRLIVFPDKETRDMALTNKDICSKRKKDWIITTLEDCKHF